MGRKKGTGLWFMAESGEQRDEHLGQQGRESEQPAVRMGMKGKGEMWPPLHGHCLIRTARLSSLVGRLDYRVPPPGMGQLRGASTALSCGICAPLCQEPAIAAPLRAKPESPPLLMPLLKPINPYISAGIFCTGAAR